MATSISPGKAKILNVEGMRDQDYGGSFVVGKDILELLSSSMYLNPLVIYREYIQNAVDSIDQAVDSAELSNSDEGRIDIVVDHIERRVIIRDNGTGLSGREFADTMTSFGASRKRGTTARGFRGVGRLAGIGYCQALKFRSRRNESDPVLEVVWDCFELKKLLTSSEFDGDLEELVRKIVSVRKDDSVGLPSRFFEVEISKPRRISNDLLLNEFEIGKYLSQVGPCPFEPDFLFKDQINDILKPIGAAANSYNIFLNESVNPIYRPYRKNIEYSQTRSGFLLELKEIEIFGIDGNTAALGWILHHDYQGAIPNSLGVRGLRARVGNLQIGDERVFKKIFPEERFCSWAVGELHVTDRRVLPNGRRDNFEFNNHLSNIITHLTPVGSEIARHCRSSSQIRARKKTFELSEQKILQKLDIIKQGAISTSAVATLKKELGTHISEMHNSAGFGLIKVKERNEMNVRRVELERLVDLLTTNSNGSNPLSAIPEEKRSTYTQIFDLIYECSANHIVAKSLIDRILSRISKI